ncbi:MAG: cytidine deaminase [Rhodobacteraceae bacterium]|nr:cytidine deaminase [Paracoccaceae bacterium]
MTMLKAAKSIRENAYAPYSGFKVGAAVRASSGKVYSGCNVENAAYPQGVCAEAGAISAMVAAGETEIAEVLVVADVSGVVAPCGGCRQKLAEFASPEVPVIMCNMTGSEEVTTIGALLPLAFAKAHMETE